MEFRPYIHMFLLTFVISGCVEMFVQVTNSRNFCEAIEIGSDTSSSAEGIEENAEHIIKEVGEPKKEIYLIDNNDVLDVVVFEEPDLSMTLRVSEKGTISYPLIGEVAVKGLTAYEVEKVIEKRLREGEYLKKPKVNVRLDIKLMEQYREKEIFVMGEVQRSGSIPILGKYITAFEAVTKAGGFTEFAAPNRTAVIRVEAGVEKTIIVNLNKVKKGDKSLDITLKPGDVVVVPEAYF